MPRHKKEEISTTISRALFELRYALIATLLVLSCVFSLYFAIPVLQGYWQTRGSEIGYEKIYTYSPTGANLEYQVSGNPSKTFTTRLTMDLEILSRRFQRKNFRIINLAGLKSTIEYQRILRYSSLYGYKVRKTENGAILTITVRNKNTQAVQALQNYLRYIEKNW